MQREISYRGQRVDTKEWVYGYLFGIWDKRYILWGTTNDIPNMIEVIPETVGQYTGLHDKNGKEIYEGDVVSCYYACELPFNAVVEFRDGCFDIKSEHSRDYLKVLVANRAIEVIGNIHDNPDYLNQPQEGE